jgi:xanthine dehydrogenase FAD-binding subunit
VVETLRPESLEEALALRAERHAIPFAGGTDLMVRHRRGAGALPGFIAPVLMLDRCRELCRIETAPKGLRVGAMVTLGDLADLAEIHPGFRDALLSMGGPALRTVATLGGNVCNASPAADSLPFLYAFDATVTLRSTRGERVLGIQDFVTGPGRTALAADELLVSILIPSWKPATFLWRKVGTRKANALTKVSIAAFADREDGRVTRAAIALGAVAPTVVRLRRTEARIVESTTSAGIAVQEGPSIRPIDDQRSTAEYRRSVAMNLVEGFIDSLFGA